MICSPVLGQVTFFSWIGDGDCIFFLYPLYYALCIPGGVVFALDTLIIYYVLTETIGIRRRSASLCLQQMREGKQGTWIFS